MSHVCLQSQVSGWWKLGGGLGWEQRVGKVVIGSCSVSASGFRWRAPRCSSGAGSSCSCKAPVFRHPMKGVWKLSIARLPSSPHPWESFPVSPLVAWLTLIYLPIDPAFRPSDMPPEFPAMYSWLFLCAFPTFGSTGTGLRGPYTSFALNFVK